MVRRFVEQQKLGTEDQGTRERDAAKHERGLPEESVVADLVGHGVDGQKRHQRRDYRHLFVVFASPPSLTLVGTGTTTMTGRRIGNSKVLLSHRPSLGTPSPNSNSWSRSYFGVEPDQSECVG